MKKVYISYKHDPSTCRFCMKKRELRVGGCWDCFEAQSILISGVDMYDKDINGKEIKESKQINFDVSIINERLKYLIKKGWHTHSEEGEEIHARQNEEGK